MLLASSPTLLLDPIRKMFLSRKPLHPKTLEPRKHQLLSAQYTSKLTGIKLFIGIYKLLN